MALFAPDGTMDRGSFDANDAPYMFNVDTVADDLQQITINDSKALCPCQKCFDDFIALIDKDSGSWNFDPAIFTEADDSHTFYNPSPNYYNPNNQDSYQSEISNTSYYIPPSSEYHYQSYNTDIYARDYSISTTTPFPDFTTVQNEASSPNTPSVANDVHSQSSMPKESRRGKGRPKLYKTRNQRLEARRRSQKKYAESLKKKGRDLDAEIQALRNTNQKLRARKEELQAMIESIHYHN